MSLALEAVGLTKDYPSPRPWRVALRAPFARSKRRALDGLDLALEPGERLALVGPNGAGKTTLARVVCGVVLPDGGTARVHGEDVARGGRAVRRAVGFARPEDPALHQRLDVLECLRFHAALYGTHASRDSLTAALEKTEAAPLAKRRVQTLSGGEKARVSLAKALLHGPRLLVLDELSRVLDPGAAARSRLLLKEFASAGGAVLLVTHDLAEAAQCDRVGVMEAGRLVAHGAWASVETKARGVFGL